MSYISLIKETKIKANEKDRIDDDDDAILTIYETIPSIPLRQQRIDVSRK